jgi:hypothetical protein
VKTAAPRRHQRVCSCSIEAPLAIELNETEQLGRGLLKPLLSHRVLRARWTRNWTQLHGWRLATMTATSAAVATSRPDVGRIENELDIPLSTLERYVEALGGRLEMHAVFDDDDVKLTA